MGTMKGRSPVWDNLRRLGRKGHETPEDPGRGLGRGRQQHRPGKLQERDWVVWKKASHLPKAKEI